MREVCVDAGLAVKLVAREPDSNLAEELFRQWVREGVHITAPDFFVVEADSILRQKAVLRQELTRELADNAFAMLQALPIRQLSVPGQRQRAWNIAQDFDFPTVYDATYLALADLRGCEFWTADERLFNRVKDRLTFVQRLGDYRPQATP